MTREITIHPCEPTLEELVSIRSQVYGEDSTELNVKKCKALESQIERHKAFREAQKEKGKEANE